MRLARYTVAVLSVAFACSFGNSCLICSAWKIWLLSAGSALHPLPVAPAGAESATDAATAAPKQAVGLAVDAATLARFAAGATPSLGRALADDAVIATATTAAVVVVVVAATTAAPSADDADDAASPSRSFAEGVCAAAAAASTATGGSAAVAEAAPGAALGALVCPRGVFSTRLSSPFRCRLLGFAVSALTVISTAAPVSYSSHPPSFG